jgi:hypothetical protein
LDWAFESSHSEKRQASVVSDLGLSQGQTVQELLRVVMVVRGSEMDSAMGVEIPVEREVQAEAEEVK